MLINDHIRDSEIIMRFPMAHRGAGYLQRAAANNTTANEAPAIVHEVLRSPGQPLDASTRAFTEPRFGHDFSGVRVHTDAKAAESARAVNALAYTIGRDIVFGEGQYMPSSPAGRRLVVHELAHTAQQGISTPMLNASLSVSEADSLEERQADHIGRSIEQQVENPSLKSHSRKDMACIHRQAAPSAQEQQFWLELGKQAHYGVLSKDKRTPMASKTGNQQADEILWTAEALIVRADKMLTFLQSHFGADKDIRVTSVVKPGEHTAYRKMDVARAGTSTWEELAAAAVHAGFWVHAEGITLGGKFWPLSPNATGPHMDLYLIKTQVGDFPAETRYASSEATPGSYEV